VTRRELAVHFGELGFTSGAEIGVERGVFSEILCQSIPGLKLLAVDMWAPKAGYREHVTAAELARFEMETRKRLARYGAHVIKGLSTDVAKTVPDGSLDFVYIDADHDYDSVYTDLAAWVPKVKRHHGIVAGHDYNLPGVEAAVDEWAEDAVLATDDRSPSWWWQRT
jgi:hypothetical protein